MVLGVYAEKFDVAGKIAAALDGFNIGSTRITIENYEKNVDAIKKAYSGRGYFNISYNGNQLLITWGFGHMCGLKQAKDYDESYAKWSNLPTPFFPNKYEIKVREGFNREKRKATGEPDKYVLYQLKKIKEVFEECDEIINATDFDREGEVIFSYVYEMLNVKKPYKRVKLNSQTEEGFKEAFDNIFMNDSVVNLENAGRGRGIADWMVGANLSVLMTLKYGQGSMITVGRVQTPVLKMIVDRELKIRNFKSEPFWTLLSNFENQNGDVFQGEYEEGRFEDKKKGEAIANAIKGKPGKIDSVEKKEEKKQVPKLYSLSSLQRDANNKFGLKANDTLAIAQKLYDKGYLTYPRSSSEFLPEDMTDTVDKVLDKLALLPEYKDYILRVPTRKYTKNHFNTKKVGSHYAIIPTNSTPTGLSGNEKNIYDLVAKSLIRVIYSSAVFEKTKAMINVDGYMFKASGSIIKDPGWMAVDAMPDKSKILPELREGEMVKSDLELKEGKTEPPKRYTDATLLTDMKNAGKKMEDKDLKQIMMEATDGGIGTEATRASIIENVVTKYATRSGKTIIPTEDAIKIIEILPLEDIKSPTLTAEWEKRLNEIAQGNEKLDSFIHDMEEQTRTWCEEIKHSTSTLQIGGNNNIDTEYKCPVCNSPIKKMKWGWVCAAYKKVEGEGCKFIFSNKIGGKNITDADLKSLITTGSTKSLELKGEKGKYFARFILSDKGTIDISFTVDIKCPKCGKPLSQREKIIGCTGYPECNFGIWTNMPGRKITVEEVKELIETGETKSYKTYKGKKGPFKAKLKLKDRETYDVKFVFQNKS